MLLLERETFPRFRIGESLMPATYWAFKKLGVLPKLRRSPFIRKQSVQFFAGSGKAGRPFYFTEIDPHESSVTWQVERSQFDQILLDHASELGVEVRQGARVTQVLMEGGRAVGVRAVLADGSRRVIRAPVTVDATGQNALLASRLGLCRLDSRLRHVSFFTRYLGGKRAPGIDEGATLILHTRQRKSWFWYIPLPADLVSVGVVGHIDHLIRGRAPDPETVFAEELAQCAPLAARLERARPQGPVRALRDFSYASRAIAGDGWVLVGDAFGFLDPIYSSGVFLALKSAELAASSIHAALGAGDPSAARLGRHGPAFIAGMEALRRLIYAYYDRGFSFSRFLEAHPEARDDLVNMLVGNVFRKSCAGILETMGAASRPDGYEPLTLPAGKA